MEPFNFATPLGPIPGRLLLEPPPVAIGPVACGFSNVTEDAIRRGQRNHRAWWHPLRNPIVTACLMAFAAILAVGSATHNAGGPAIIIVVVGYALAKAVGAIVTAIRAAPPLTNTLVGEHGMFDVVAGAAGSRELTLWKDVAWWGATPIVVNGHPMLRTHIVDHDGRVRYPAGFTTRFKSSPQIDPETAVLEAARERWTSYKLAEISRLLSSAPGAAIEMPLLTDERVRPTALRPGSFVRLSRDRVTAYVDGKPTFDAPRTATTLAFDSRRDAWVNATRSFCELRAGDASWSVRCAELASLEVLMQLIPRAA
jgi:hypothetical protein